MDLHPRTYLLSVFIVVAVLLAGWLNTPLWPQAAEKAATVAAEANEPTATDGEKSKDAKEEDGKGITPPEYVGPARPREASYAFAQLRRAQELFENKDWAKGLGILDGLLAEDPESFADGEEAEPDPKDEGEPVPAGAVVPGGNVGVARAVFRRGAPPEPEAPKAVPPSQVVVTADGIHYATLAETIRRVVATLSAEARDVYQKTYDPPARRRFEEAAAMSFRASLPALREVATRYPLTEAAREALGLLGDRALDLGRAARAADAYAEQLHATETLSAAESPRAAPAFRRSLLTLLAKLLLANREAGRDSEADVIARRIENFRSTTISVGGKPLTGRDLLEQPFARSQAELAATARLPTWPCAMGTPNHVAPELAESALPPLGSRADWIHSFSGPTSERAAMERRSSRRLKLGQRFPLRHTNFPAAYPAVQVATRPGVIFVRSAGELVALAAGTGKIRWRSNLQAVGSGVPLFHPTPKNVNGVFRNLGGSSITLVGDLAIIIDAQSQPHYDRKGNLSYGANALFAFDVDTGKLRWRVGGATGQPESLRTYSFTSSPTHAGGDLLVAPATQDDGPSIVGLTTGGKVRWIEKLYNYNAGYLRQHREAVSQGASLAVAGGVAVSAPGHGIVAAIEVETGRIHWLTRYPTLNVKQRGLTIWAPAHPIVSGRRVLVAPHDSAALLTLDLDTGETLWERRYADDRYQLLGADDEVAFVVGDRVEAIDIETNELRWISDSLEYSAGRGFATLNRLYVPLEDAIAVLDAKTGRITHRLGFTDPRLTGLKPANLAIVALEPALGEERVAEDTAPEESARTRVIAMGGWGVAAVEPQGDSWARAGSEASSKSFARARLLLADGRYDEALDLLESLLEASRSDASINTARTLIVDTARKAARSREDPLPIARILERPDLVPDAAGRISLKLELAKLFEKSDARAAAQLYHEIRAQTVEEKIREPLFTPDNVLALADRYAADSLHLLGAAGVVERAVEEEKEAAASIRTASEIIHSSDDEAKRRRARRSLERIAFRRPYLESAAEALSHLSALASSEGELSETAGYLQRLAIAYPKLKEDDRIRSLGRQFDAALESEPTLPSSLAIAGKKDGVAWEKVFWKGVDEGVLVESVNGSEPLREIFTLRGGGLQVFSAKGDEIGAVDLPSFPDIEIAKAALQSHIEEPAQIFANVGKGYLFSAAGLYALELPENPFAFDDPQTEPQKRESDEENGAADTARDVKTVTDAGPRLALPKLGWRQTYEHAIERLRRNSPRRWGFRSLLRVSGNLFPYFLVRNEGEEAIVLESDGGVFGVNLTSGKVRRRISGGGHTPLGPPKLRGTELVSVTTRPGGVVVYDLSDRRSDDQESTVPAVKFKTRSDAQKVIAAALVPKIAVVFDTASGVLVESYTGGDTLWRTRNSRYVPTLARVNAAHVWIVDPRGKLRCHALLSGRVLWEVSVPKGCTPVAQFETRSEQPGEEGERTFWVALMTEGQMARRRYWPSMTENGKSLNLIKITESGKKLYEVTIGGNGMTYLGHRWTVRDRWLLVYNQADENSVWTSRATSFDPVNGDYEVLFEAPIAGKGTGLPPRLALVQTSADGALALAFGNSEGFGLFRPQPTQSTEPAGPKGKIPEDAVANGTITEGTDAEEAAK